MSAFVPSSLSRPVLRETSFTGTSPSRCAVSRRTSVSPNMKTDIDGTLQKYDQMSNQPAKPTLPSKPSGVWSKYLSTITEKQFNPMGKDKPSYPTVISRDFLNGTLFSPKSAYFTVQLAGGARFVPTGDPDKLCTQFPAADRYMAKCVNMQYKMTAVPNGIYSVRCTEGTVRQQAEESRSAALSAEFRLKQRSVKQKFGDYTETRRRAIIAAQGCSYEEKLVDKYPAAARAVVRGYSEAKGVCVRYAVGATPAEKYMADCVDKQSKFRAVPYGVYDVLCSDGNAKTVAEYKRVSGLAARFRAGQLSKPAKEQVKFDSAKYARDNFGHGCSYEEALFNAYPAVSASMRPDSARY